MYDNDHEGMDEDYYTDDAQATQQETQQQTQESSQEGSELYNEHLWGSFIPIQRDFPRYDLWKTDSEYTLGRSQANSLIMKGLKISMYSYIVYM